MSKKLIKLMLIGTGLLVLLFVVLWIISLFRGGKLSYDKIEDKMISAAESYYKNNANLLPKDDYSKVELDASTLVADGYMKSFDKYTDENVSCNGKIIVLKNGENYTYIPKLNCGNDYSTTTLSQKILENESIITEGDGLYEYNEEYVYRGEKLNNYVSFAGKTWRVLRITKDRELRLIQNDSFEKVVWDNRYNASKKSSTGINDYEINGIDSRIKEFLKEIYDSEILKSKDKAKLVPKQLCIGKILRDLSLPRRIEKSGNSGGHERCRNLRYDRCFGYHLLRAKASGAFQHRIYADRCIYFGYRRFGTGC